MLKLNTLKQILECPTCKTKLKNKLIACKKCSKTYLKDNRLYFIKTNSEFKTENWFDKFKSKLKKDPKLYKFIIRVLSPVSSNPDIKIKKWLRLFKKNSIIIDVGSGANRFRKDIINVDVFDYDNVNIIADATKLPFQNESIDGIINIAVLEHVKNPKEFVNEFYRVLKKRGKFFVFIPFLQGYHASPNDYYRWTKQGAKQLFSKFNNVKVTVADGPTSSLLWIFQEWFAITFSFYNKHLYRALLLLIMLITFPIKFLDLFIKHHPEASNITSGFYVTGEK
jgi:SAM-dependent methyltransferase